MFANILSCVKHVHTYMAHATLVISPPENIWAHQISSRYPETTFRVLAAVPTDNAGFALARVNGEDVFNAVTAMVEHPQIKDLTPIQQSEDEATIHFEAASPFLFMASQESGIAVNFPVIIQNCEAIVEVIGARDHLSEFVEELDSFGLNYRLKQIGDRYHESQLLSDRQREFVLTALEHGYYDTPRQCSLTDVAAELGVAKSTCSETLHRAEETIVKQFVAQLPEVDTEQLDEDANRVYPS